MKKIIVTGGAGFIGSHIVDRLIDEGFEVAILYNISSGNRLNINNEAKLYEVNLYNGNISSIIKDFQPNLVFHLAAQSSVSVSESNPIEDASNNILGSLNLYQACKNTSVEKIILSSNGGAIYWNQNELDHHEET